MPEAVSIPQRRADYRIAEERVLEVAERWTERRAGGARSEAGDAEFDEAIRLLTAAKSRLEKAERKERKRRGPQER